jgi:hypothetical protein
MESDGTEVKCVVAQATKSQNYKTWTWKQARFLQITNPYLAWIWYGHLLRCPSRKFSLMTSVNPRKHGIVRLIGCMGGIIICVNYKSMHACAWHNNIHALRHNTQLSQALDVTLEEYFGLAFWRRRQDELNACYEKKEFYTSQLLMCLVSIFLWFHWVAWYHASLLWDNDKHSFRSPLAICSIFHNFTSFTIFWDSCMQ